MIIYDIPQEKIGQIEKQYRSEFWFFAHVIGGDLMQKMPVVEFYNATEAWEFAKQAEQRTSYLKGLKESAEKGTVGKWAKTIIKYFRESSKGAGNYRVLEVAA